MLSLHKYTGALAMALLCALHANSVFSEELAVPQMRDELMAGAHQQLLETLNGIRPDTPKPGLRSVRGWVADMVADVLPEAGQSWAARGFRHWKVPAACSMALNRHKTLDYPTFWIHQVEGDYDCEWGGVTFVATIRVILRDSGDELTWITTDLVGLEESF